MLCSTTEEPSAHTARRKTTPRSNTLARGHLNKTHELVCKINVFGYKYGGRGLCTRANHHHPPAPASAAFPRPREAARGAWPAPRGRGHRRGGRGQGAPWRRRARGAPGARRCPAKRLGGRCPAPCRRQATEHRGAFRCLLSPRARCLWAQASRQHGHRGGVLLS